VVARRLDWIDFELEWVSFPEEASTVRGDLREIGPDVMFSPPRIWEDMLAGVQVRVGEAGWVKRAGFAWGYAVGERLVELRVHGQRPSPGRRLVGAVAELLALRPVREQLGLTRVRHCYTGGAPLGPDVFRSFQAIGVNLKQIYGQTEIAGISVVHLDGDVRYDTVGKPIPETEVRIAPDGEILSKSPCVFKGYYKNPEATAETLKDGWLHSGDIGFIDDRGHLVVFDRRKDVMTLADGNRFSPQYLETRLKFSPYIKDAWILGDKRQAVTAVICIDAGVVGKWAEDNHIPYTSYPELSQKPEVQALVREAVLHVNKGLPPPARIQRFVNLHKEFDPDDGEVTRTRKLRRNVIEERYAPVVQAIYGGGASVAMQAQVTYESGDTGTIERTLSVREVG
jgi:long-chain acyl-CoA synthetase